MAITAGILSMQKVINYGSVLQAYALKQMLLAAGADSVTFMDIKPGRQLKKYVHKGLISRLLEREPLRHPIRFCKDLLFSKKYHKSVMSGWPWLGIDNNSSEKKEQKIDIAVIGSDEVFNICQPTAWGFSSQLFGDISGPKRIISYAGSFGNTRLQDLKELNIAEEVGHYMCRMHAISVRDRNSVQIVEHITGTKPHCHIDPVLAYGYKKEIGAFVPSKDKDKYIVVYTYHRRITDKKEIDSICSYARAKGKRLVSVMCRYDWCDSYANVKSPLHVLSIFKDAHAIITDTFHGTIFSIITHSKFGTLVRQSNYNKLTSLLRDASLEDRIVDRPENLSAVIDSPIDYDSVETALSPLRKSSAEYLQKQLCSI